MGIRVNSLAPIAAWRRLRLSCTLSRVSHSVNPRFRTHLPRRVLTPPGRVLKPWTSHGILESAGTCSTRIPLKLRAAQRLAAEDAFRFFGLRSFARDVFVAAMTVPL